MLTSRGLALLVGAALAVAVGRLLGVTELLLVATAAVALVILAALSVRLSAATVSVRRETLPTRLAFGATGHARLQLHNTSRLPAALLLVEDHCPAALAAPPRFVVPSLAKGAMRLVRYRIRGGARGRHRLGPVTVRVQDPFGLAERVRRVPAIDEVIIHPQVEVLSGVRPGGGRQGDARGRSARPLSSTVEFHSLREYVRGDELRRIHWPSSARRQTLIVRQHEHAEQAHATVFCDTRELVHRGRGEVPTLEKALSVAASVLVTLADQGFATQLVTEVFSTPMPALARRRNHSAVTPLLDRLAEVEPSEIHALRPALQRLGAHGARGLLVAVLGPPLANEDSAAVADMAALRVAGRAYRQRIAVIVVDPARRLSAERAKPLAATLSAAGWATAVVSADEPFAPLWQQLAAGPHRGTRGGRVAS